MCRLNALEIAMTYIFVLIGALGIGKKLNGKTDSLIVSWQLVFMILLIIDMCNYFKG